MRHWLLFLLMIACDDDASFTKADVDHAFVAKDYERLCRGVRASDDDVRVYAAEKLASVNDSEANACVCEALDNKAGGWDEPVARGLQDSDNTTIAGCFLDLVKTPDLNEREDAIAALSRMTAPNIPEGMMTLLSDPSVSGWTRASIIEKLPRRASDAELLVDLMKGGDDPQLQAAAATKLAVDTYPDEEVKDALIEVASPESKHPGVVYDTSVRIAAIASLRKRDPSGSKTRYVVKKAVTGRDMAVREGIFYQLAGTQVDFEVEQLAEAVTTKQTTAGARTALLHALVESGCGGRTEAGPPRNCRGSHQSARQALCDGIPYWLKHYLDSEYHADRPDIGEDILIAQNLADDKTSMACLEETLNSRTSELSCFATYYLKWYYAKQYLGGADTQGRLLDELQLTGYEKSFIRLKASGTSHEFKGCDPAPEAQ